MLISLNWLRDFVDLPQGLDAHQFAERFTVTCAEVEDVFELAPGDRIKDCETSVTVADCVIEVDNKSITHRPDLWGHYGVAREVAAMYRCPLKPLDVAEGDRLDDDALPAIPIVIDDPQACPRYTALRLSGVQSKPAPDWMQTRLASVGIRSINALVDLTNYIMVELGQPMHVFDGDLVNEIEVGFARQDETLKTLDGVSRSLNTESLMIQSQRRHIALAGIMGGLDTEVGDRTESIVLESANFDAATVRRCASALAHRTDASVRFEKSLDPANTVLAVARFVHLAEGIFPDLRLSSQLSDEFPNPPASVRINIEPARVSELMGKSVSLAQIKEILTALGFKIEDQDHGVDVIVPSFRATKDIEEQADVIEEIARFVGYGNIDPAMPQVTLRHLPANAEHTQERHALELFCGGEGYHEIHDYLWYDDDWINGVLRYDPGDCQTLKNPPTQQCRRLRKSLMPNLIRIAERNRRAFPTAKLAVLGTVFPFERTAPEDADVQTQQQRTLGLLSMIRGKKAEDQLIDDLKGSLAKWALDSIDGTLAYQHVDQPKRPWEHPHKTAALQVDGRVIGSVTTVPTTLKTAVSEHFNAWSVACAEINLSALPATASTARKMPEIPRFPEVELDFSILVDRTQRYADVETKLKGFDHGLLRVLSYREYYQGSNLPDGKRNLLLRTVVADPERTLSEQDIVGFRNAFEQFLESNKWMLRQ